MASLSFPRGESLAKYGLRKLWWEGDAANRYTLEATLSTHSPYVLVHRATDRDTGTPVIMKVWDVLDETPAEARTALSRESLRAIKCTRDCMPHPNLITCHDAFVTHNRVWVVLEAAPHGTLADRIARAVSGAQPWRDEAEIWGYFADVVAAVRHMNSNGVFHRDVRPEHIVLCDGPDGTVRAKMIDFGVAQVISERVRAVGSRALAMLLYKPPERLVGTSAGALSDVWRLGCLLYELTTGASPFATPERRPAFAVMEAIVSGSFPPLREEQGSPALRGLVAGMLQTTPAERVSMDEVWEVAHRSRGGSQGGTAGTGGTGA